MPDQTGGDLAALPLFPNRATALQHETTAGNHPESRTSATRSWHDPVAHNLGTRPDLVGRKGLISPEGESSTDPCCPDESGSAVLILPLNFGRTTSALPNCVTGTERATRFFAQVWHR